jgi:hypothetical protein
MARRKHVFFTSVNNEGPYRECVRWKSVASRKRNPHPLYRRLLTRTTFGYLPVSEIGLRAFDLPPCRDIALNQPGMFRMRLLTIGSLCSFVMEYPKMGSVARNIFDSYPDLVSARRISSRR